MWFDEAARAELEEIARLDLRRVCRRVEAVAPGRIRVDGRWLLHLASNDYLGLAQHPRLKEAAAEALARFGTGAGSARLIGGTSSLHEALEEALARFKGAEAALLFSTGYQANLGVITALAGPGDLVVGDRLNHASLIDACRLSGAAFRVYPHLDAARLREILRVRRGKYRRTWVVTEGVFSMDGDVAPLAGILEAARAFEAGVVVDDAHGTGVLGAGGRGTADHLGVRAGEVIQVGTLSKALGGVGGFVAASRPVVELLKSKARAFIYTTAPPAAVAAAGLEALRVLEVEPERLARLRQNALAWRGRLSGLPFAAPFGEGPIVPVRVGESRRAMELSDALFEAGVYAPGIRPPTVPEGEARVRTSVTASHAPADLEEAFAALSAAFEKTGRNEIAV